MTIESRLRKLERRVKTQTDTQDRRELEELRERLQRMTPEELLTAYDEAMNRSKTPEEQAKDKAMYEAAMRLPIRTLTAMCLESLQGGRSMEECLKPYMTGEPYDKH